MGKTFKNLTRAERYELQILGKITLDTPSGADLEGGEPFLCNMVNMSLSGALVETGTNMPLGSLLKYSFRIPGVDNTVSVLAEVVRRDGPEDTEEGPWEGGTERTGSCQRERLTVYGIRFLDLKAQDRSTIKGYLRP
jgi:hypothetical protein